MIKPMWRLVALSLLLPLTAGAQTPRVQEPEQSRPWAVYFSVEGGAAQAVVEALGRAKHDVRVQAVALSAPEISQARVNAHHRGVAVEVVLHGKRSTRSSAAATLAQAGIRTLRDTAHSTADTNAMVIDHQVVIVGGFSFAPSAEGSLLVIHDPTLAGRYSENWQLHAAHSERYAPKP
jgi:phosphatidylserine/phosphatidylglycerophosphate/cardiolipin synthase-like enzyme